MQTVNLNSAKWKPRFTYTKVVPFELPCKFQVVKFNAGKSIGNHYHLKTTEIYVVIDGVGTLFINDEPHHLKKNYIYLIEPKDTHRIIAKTKLLIAIFKPHEASNDIYRGLS